MDVKSICKLIESSSKCGVSRLKLGDLEIRFNDSAKPAEPTYPQYDEFAESNDIESAPTSGDRPSAKIPKDLVQRFAEEQQLIDDPLAFEDLQVDMQQGLFGDG